jgi:hypothetical protein
MSEQTYTLHRGRRHSSDPQSQREATSPTPGRALTRALDTAPATQNPTNKDAHQ